MRIALLALFVAPIAFASPLFAQCEVSIVSSDLAPGDQFGWAVSTDGSCMAVGAPGDDDFGSSSGAVYLFERDAAGWTEVQKLAPADGEAGDLFGHSVSLWDGVLFIGAPGDGNNGPEGGTVYVYGRSGGQWAPQAKLFGSQIDSGDQFGISVSVVGNIAAIGASGDEPSGFLSGSAHIYRRVSGQWQYQAYLSASDGAPSDYFGNAVCVDVNRILVGAYGHDVGGSGAGAVYVFEPSGGSWPQVQKLQPNDPAAVDFFGWDIDSSLGRVVISAYGKGSAAGSLSGAAYLFQYGGGQYSQSAKLVPDVQAQGDQFGFSVGVDGDQVLIGAVQADLQGPESGASYLFERSGGSWFQSKVSDYAGLAPGQRLGFAADLADNVLATTSMTNSSVGAAWMERGPFGDCNGNGVADGCDIDGGTSQDLDGDRVPDECGTNVVFCTCDQGAPCGNVDSGGGCANSTGLGARLQVAGGSFSVGADDLRLRIDGMPPISYSLFFMGASEGSPAVLGAGQRCVQAPLYRFPLVLGDQAGSAELGPGFVVFSQVFFPPGAVISAGSTWRFQAWYRDAFSACATSNTTQGLALTFVP